MTSQSPDQTNMDVPVLSAQAVYAAPSHAVQTARYETIRRRFVETYGAEPAFLARSPGRVNLIGEHIDYCGYSVLPMAVEKDIVVAVGKRAGDLQLHAANVNDAKYPKRVFEHDKFTIDPAKHDWTSYFLAGYKKYFEETPDAVPTGLNLMFDGTVPPGSGLSSSSAMVCCSILATSHATGGKHPLPVLADIAIRGERYVGVQSGGMDQSISLMAELGHAKLIDFHPLHLTSVTLPANASFIIAHSLVTSDKQGESALMNRRNAVTAPRHYNLRVTECRFAAKLLTQELTKAHVSSASADHSKSRKKRKEDSFIILKDVQQQFGLSFEEALAAVDTHLKREPYSRKELANAFGTTVAELESEFLGHITVHGDEFRLWQRARHVYSEAKRVYDFKAVCDKQATSSAAPTHAVLKELGALMDSSQTSCHELFDCSCPELEELTAISRANGAFGSRLTGAGWGGCSVSLVEAGKEHEFIQAVREKFYRNGERLKGGETLEDVLFATLPGSGGCIVTM